MGLSVVAALVIAAVSAAASVYVSVEAKKQAKKATEQARKSASRDAQKYMFKSAVAAKQIVLGHPVLSGPMVYGGEEGEPNDAGEGEWVHYIVHLAGHVCDDVTHAWLDDVQLNRYEASTSGADIEFRHENGSGFVYIYLGEQTQAPPTLSHLPDWNANMIGREQCFAHVKLQSNPFKWAGGIPNPKFAVRGLKVFDPRTNQTAWTDNPALLVRWYRNALKQGVAMDDTYITSANICDEIVATPEGGQEKRYRCNYAFMADQGPRTILSTIRATCDGVSLRVAGRHAFQVGAYYGPGITTLTEDDIVGDITTMPDVRRRDRINTISAKYTDPLSNWNEVDMPRVVHEGYLAQDGYEVVDDLDLRAVPSPYQAQRLALIQILTTRDAMSIEFTSNLRGTRLLPGSVFKLNLPENEWDGVEFIVSKWKYSTNGLVTLVAKQTKPSHYAFNGDTAKVPSRPGVPSLVSRDVPAVTNLSYATLADSNTLQAVITWQHKSLGISTFELSFYKDGEFLRKELTVDKQYRLQDGFEVGQYQVQVVAISYERRSPVASLVFNASAPQTPIGIDVKAENWALGLTPVSAGVVNFDTMYDFALGFEQGATDEQVEQYIVGRAKVITVSNLKANTTYQIAVREVSRWGKSGWYRSSAQTTFNSDDVLELIDGKVTQEMLDGNLNDFLTQVDERSQAMNLDQDARYEMLLNAIQASGREQTRQESSLDLIATQNKNSAFITELQRVSVENGQAISENKSFLLADIEQSEARANEYTRAAVGYCVDAQGNITSETDAVLCVQAGHNWIQGPLAEYIRNLSIQNAAGETATISDMMQAFENEEGKLIVRGGMTVNNQGKISGFVNTNDGTLSQTDFIADFFRIGTMNGENFEPVFGLDAVSRKLVLKGRLILDDGSLISNKDELQGKDGTIWGALKLRDGIFPSDALATADFTARYGRAPMLDDMLTYVSNDGSVSSTKSYNGTAWVAPALRLSGDLITPGTIFGDRFVAGSELTSPVIKGGEAYFGKETGAPFDGYHTKISPNGLIETDRIKATGGEFDHVTIGENCEILGTLTAGQIVGDLVKVSVANITENMFATANRPSSGTATGYETIAQIDIGQADWSRAVVVPNGIIFDNFNSLAGIQYVVDGVVYHQHDTTNLNSYPFDGKHATYAGVFIVPPGTSGVVTIRLFTEIPFNAPFDYSRGYIYSGTSFVLTNFKSS
ncbi:phage tail tip protein J-related protein [Vibrio vulnificus]|uniref:phage tail tip protein J-related protein n=1 Tax=Vibrio vulnificus TaxID=672 RepID=UPI00102C6A76|nr:phage tail protein [Vibrio vulnificus]RZR41621.1 hypothetical protein D8T58_20775 [Vibrio vulnificus]